VAILSMAFMQQGPLLVLELVDDRRAEGGELRDGERRRHAEMGGGLAEVGNLCSYSERPSPMITLTCRLTSRWLNPCRNARIGRYSALSCALTSQSRSGQGASCARLRKAWSRSCSLGRAGCRVRAGRPADAGPDSASARTARRSRLP
jgi:hypothetical protein